MARIGNNLPQWVKDHPAGVEDANEPLNIIVRTDDIRAAVDAGSFSNGNACVLAQSLVRLGVQNAYVYRSTVWIDFGTDEPIVRYMASSAAKKKAIIPYDEQRFEDIESGVYRLNPPAPSQRLGMPAKYRQKRREEAREGLMPYLSGRGIPRKHNDGRQIMATVGRKPTNSK